MSVLGMVQVGLSIATAFAASGASLSGRGVSAAEMIEKSWSGPRVVGHRGAAAYKPENTIEAFREGIACGADAIECDVHVSRDGELMVMHDDTLDRTTKLRGAIADTDSATMRAAGVPTLREYLEVARGKAVAIVELKGGEGVARKSVDLIRKMGMVDQTILFSFNPQLLDEATKIEPKLYAVWLVGYQLDSGMMNWIRKKAGAKAIGLDYSQANEQLVQAMHKERTPVFVWTVPPGQEVDRLKALKTNFIITNHPRDVREQLAQ